MAEITSKSAIGANGLQGRISVMMADPAEVESCSDPSTLFVLNGLHVGNHTNNLTRL